ncbi:MAG: alkaline phosphatase family protein [bacterium]|nr:alkaline phosphatase family protein [bacterium]
MRLKPLLAIFGLSLLLVVLFIAYRLIGDPRKSPSVITRPDTSPAVDVTVSEVDFETMNDFLSDHGGRSNDQVVFIGLDGATWGIIDPMIEEGLLPTFARLKAEGSSGILRSTDCYFTPPAWTSMLTGFSPQKTGVYTFGKWLPEEKEFRAVSSVDVEVPYIWDIASRADRRSAVANVPVTYPVQPVNGIMISGLMTPIVYASGIKPTSVRTRRFVGRFDKDLDSRSYTPPLIMRTVLSINTFVMVMYDTVDDNVHIYDTIALKVFPTGGDWKVSDDVPVTAFTFGEYSPWFQFDYRKPSGDIRETRRVAGSIKVEGDGAGIVNRPIRTSPFLRLPSDPELKMTYPDSLGAEIEEEFGYYLVTLGFAGDAVPQGAELTAGFARYFYDYDDWDFFSYVFMAPDNIQHHEGFSDRTRQVYQTIDRFLGELIGTLPEDATLVIASDHGFREYKYVIDLNKYFASLGLLSTPREVNHDETVVFHNRWCLYFNDALVTVEELEKRGVPVTAGEAPREALVRFLKEACDAVPHGNDRLSVELVDVPADAVGQPPDLIVRGGYAGYFVEGSDLSINARTIVREASERESWYHDRDGIYLMWGNHIRKGINGQAKNIADIAPTILYLLGLPQSRDFDGTLMTTIIEPETLGERPIRFVGDYVSQMPEKDLSFEELETLQEKLRSLGYIR